MTMTAFNTLPLGHVESHVYCLDKQLFAENKNVCGLNEMSTFCCVVIQDLAESTALWM
jgi:hypothetical protein